MTKSERQALKDQFWAWCPTDIDQLTHQTDQLLDALTDDQLADFVGDRVEDEEDDDD